MYSGATNEKASDSFDSLRLESKGSDVKKVQIRLKELGYFKEDATSFFGEVTEKAVKAFQKNNGLSQDGVVGKKTFNLLFSTDAKKAASAATTTAITAKEQEEIEWDEAKWADADLGEPAATPSSRRPSALRASRSERDMSAAAKAPISLTARALLIMCSSMWA